MALKLRLLIVAAGAVTLTVHADPASSSSVPPPEVSFQPYKNAFYAEVNGGAIFFNAPTKDASNIFAGQATAAFVINGHPIAPFSTEATTGSVGGTFGYVIDQHPTDSWMGSSLRAEVNGNYFQTSSSDGSQFNANASGFGPLSYLAVGRLDGQNGSFKPTVITTWLMANPFANVAFTSNDEVYDVDAVVKTDYVVADGAFTFTPKFGFAYADIDQRFDTMTTGAITTGPTFVHDLEKIESDYYGGVLGLECKANVSKEFTVFAETTTTLSYVSSSYTGNQNFSGGASVGTMTPGADSATDSRSSFNLREQADGGFYYRLGPVTLKVSGGIDYWSDVAGVQEASAPTGSSVVPLPGGVNVAPSHLVSTSMVNPEANIAVIVPF